MKTSKIFWGVLFLSLGIFSLLSYLGINIFYDFDSSITIPILLVILGLVILFKQNSIKTFFVILAALISAYAIFNIFWDGNECDWERTEDVSISEDSFSGVQTIEMPSGIKEAKLNVLGAANEINISGFKSGSNLAKINAEKLSNLDVNYSFDSTFAKLSIQPSETVSHKFNHKYFNDFNLFLNDKPEWDIEIKSGANETDLDLRKLKVKNIKLKTAASDMDVYIGTKQKLTNMDLKLAAMDIVIHIPKSAGCLINGDFIFVDKHLPGFTKDASGTYTSENFSASSQKININLHGTIADFTIKYY